MMCLYAESSSAVVANPLATRFRPREAVICRQGCRWGGTVTRRIGTGKVIG